MTAPGGAGDREDEQPATVRMPTARPAPAPSGVFEIVPARRGFLEPDGTVWPADPALPGPGEVRGPGTYGGT